MKAFRILLVCWICYLGSVFVDAAVSEQLKVPTQVLRTQMASVMEAYHAQAVEYMQQGQTSFMIVTTDVREQVFQGMYYSTQELV